MPSPSTFNDGKINSPSGQVFDDLIKMIEQEWSMGPHKSLDLPPQADKFDTLSSMELYLTRMSDEEYGWRAGSDSAVFCDKDRTSILHVYPKKGSIQQAPHIGITQEQLKNYYEFTAKMTGNYEVSLSSGKASFGSQVFNLLNGRSRKMSTIAILPPPNIINATQEGGHCLYSHTPFAEGMTYAEADARYPAGTLANIDDINHAVKEITEKKGLENPVSIGFIHYTNVRVVMSSDGKAVERYIITDLAEKIDG